MSVLDRRSFGVLLPIFSLPGNGTLDGARDFVSFLSDTDASIWQVLPIGPTHADLSPYLSLSAHAANPALLGLTTLARPSQLTPVFGQFRLVCDCKLLIYKSLEC